MCGDARACGGDQAGSRIRVSKRDYNSLTRLRPGYISGYFASKILDKTTGYEEVFLKQALRRKKAKNYMIIEGLEDYKKTESAGESLDLHTQAKEMIGAIRNNFKDYKSNSPKG